LIAYLTNSSVIHRISVSNPIQHGFFSLQRKHGEGGVKTNPQFIFYRSALETWYLA